MRIRTELRRHPRTRFEANIRAGWVDARGHQKFCSTQSLDISISGLRLDLPESLVARSVVTVKSDQLRLHTSGTVRHCGRNGTRYAVGIEFSAGYRWAPVLPEVQGEPVTVEILVSQPR